MSSHSDSTSRSDSVSRGRSLTLRASNALVNRGLRDIAEFGNRARAEELVIFGNAYRKMNDYNKAIWYYTRAIEADPDYGIAYFQRGYTNGNWFSRVDAIADYTEVIRLDPNDAEAYFNRGFNYDMWGNDISLAIADYTEAIRLDPQMARAYYRRAEAYRVRKGEYDRAIADYTEAMRLFPKDGSEYAAVCSDRARFLQENVEYDRAIADYTELIRLDPKDACAYYERGRAYQKKGDLAKAESDFGEAKRLGYRL